MFSWKKLLTGLVGLGFGVRPAMASDCPSGEPILEELTCSSTITGTMTGNDVSDLGGLCSTDDCYECGSPYKPLSQNGMEDVYSFTCQVSGTVDMDVTGMTCDFDMYILDNSCDPSNGCEAGSTWNKTTNDGLAFTCTEGETYYVVVEGYGYGAAGPGKCNGTEHYTLSFDVSASTGCNEDCDNGADDDLDGDVDCEDTDCASDPVCGCDADSDGFDKASCGGNDCDDTDPDVFPGADEYCNEIDDDCDGTVDEADAVDATDWHIDSDGDLHGNPNMGSTSCDPVGNAVAIGDDCNDSKANIHPGATELCDGIDNDCDLAVDEGATGPTTWYRDADADAYGRSSQTSNLCIQPTGYVAQAGDCNDSVFAIHPGAQEYCNDLDDDCDGTIDESGALGGTTWYGDGDSDAYGDPTDTAVACDPPQNYVGNDDDCNDNVQSTHPGATELCDGIDNDCDLAVDEGATGSTTWYRDADADAYGLSNQTSNLCLQPNGYVAQSGDCNDSVFAIHPGAQEYCNDLDDDCDGTIDESGALGGTTWYGDGDSDTYGDPADTAVACDPPATYVANDDDCNDNVQAIHPGASEVCNDLDDDCDGSTDENAVDAVSWYADADADSYGDPANSEDSCDMPANHVANSADCNDGSATVHPGAPEIPYDGIDQDCIGGDWVDVDGDGYVGSDVAGPDCADGWADIHPGAPELQNGADDDCDGVVDETTDAYDDDDDGSTEEGGDCDDADADIGPGAVEVCDQVDQDCDGIVDEETACYDDDGDGFSEDEGDCNDEQSVVHPNATEIADNGVDDDCDGQVDDGVYDPDGDGYTVAGGDCDNSDPDVHPGAAETADGVDEDCDGIVDEGTDAYDDDGDGHSENDGDCNDEDETIDIGAEEDPENGRDDDCDGDVDEGGPAFDDDGDGWTEDAGDCDDANDTVAPGQTEASNGVDDDCDGEVDEGLSDLDGDGWTAEEGDCDDSNGWASPDVPEVCDGIDNDCNGVVDDPCGLGLEEAEPKNCGCQSSTFGGAWWILGASVVFLRRRRWLPWSAVALSAGCQSENDIGEIRKSLSVQTSVVDFGEVVIGDAVQLPVTLKHESGTAIEVTGLELDDSSGIFSVVDAFPITVDPDTTTEVLVQYAPTAEGWNFTSGNFVSEDVTTELRFEAGGRGLLGSAEVWPASIDFGPVAPSESANDAITVVNDGTANFSVDGIAFSSAEFSVVSALPLEVPAGESVEVEIRFTATDAATREATATLDLTGDLSVPPVTLRGNDCENGLPSAYDQDEDGYTTCAGDCDDEDLSIHSGAPEIADGFDQDCDGTADEGTSAFDDDGDGASEDEGDCNDADPLVAETAPEVLENGIDDDCDGTIDLGTNDQDGDGYSVDGGDCDDLDAQVHPGAPEVADGQDQDCDSLLDEGTTAYDDDQDGYSEGQGDCDDQVSAIHPSAVEAANGIDDDCDLNVDEGTSLGDDDGDGFNELGGDCNDANANVSPGQFEVLGNSTDEDCDGTAE